VALRGRSSNLILLHSVAIIQLQQPTQDFGGFSKRSFLGVELFESVSSVTLTIEEGSSRFISLPKARSWQSSTLSTKELVHLKVKWIFKFAYLLGNFAEQSSLGAQARLGSELQCQHS